MSVATTAQASLQRDWAVITAVVPRAVSSTSGEKGTSQADIDSPAQEALKKINEIYETNEAVVTQIVVRIETANVLPSCPTFWETSIVPYQSLPKSTAMNGLEISISRIEPWLYLAAKIVSN